MASRLRPWLGFSVLVALMLGLGYDSYRKDAPRRAAAAQSAGGCCGVASPLVEAAEGAVASAAPPVSVNQWSTSPELVSALRDPDADVRLAAALTLAQRRDARAVEPLIALLGHGASQWRAAQALAEIRGARAEAVLLQAIRAKNYPVMSGAHLFYLRRRDPALEPALIDLLHHGGDLVVAQGFILEGSPRLATAARTWAGERGFTLVKSGQGGGHTWTETK